MPQELTVIVLAAGGGTRMRSKTNKVLHPLAGRSMVGHVLHAVLATQPAQIVAVIGHQRDQVGPHITALAPDVVLAVRDEQRGTGHAVRVAMQDATQTSGTVLVAYADTPLLRGETLIAFAAEHEAAQRAVSVLSGVVADPTGYGRVVRDADGEVVGIVEQRDASHDQRQITEINSGILAFDAAFLREALPRLVDDNAQGEYYLTDTVALARDAGLTVGAHVLDDVRQTEGVNDRAQLAEIGRELNARIVARWMAEGVSVMDPATTWIDADVELAPDVTLLPGIQLLGTTVVDEDAVIGPDCTLQDCEIGAGARVVRTHALLAVIGAGASVGPFTYLRPGTRLGSGGKLGAFVEVKNSDIGDGAKVPHLSYVGDAEIGEGTNIGAGTIVANYDGVAKHRTTVGAHARTGANNPFVAPVSIGDGAGTGAGTVVRRDVPAGALATSSGPQRHQDDWVARRRPGTTQDRAAKQSLAESPPGGDERPDQT